MTALNRLCESILLEKHCYGLAGLPRCAIDPWLQNEINTFRRVQNTVEPSGFQRLCRQGAWCVRHCFVNTAIDHKPLRPKCIPCDQNRDRKNRNGNFCPRSHFRISSTSPRGTRDSPAKR